MKLTAIKKENIPKIKSKHYPHFYKFLLRRSLNMDNEYRPPNLLNTDLIFSVNDIQTIDFLSLSTALNPLNPI